MEELFRFSVIRAATRSSASSISLERPPATQPTIPPKVPAAPPTSIPANQTFYNIRGSKPIMLNKLPESVVSRANQTITPNEGGSNTAATPKSFQDQLREIVQNLLGDHLSPEKIWKQLEPIALEFILNKAHLILNDTLWMELQNFLDNFQQQLINWKTDPKINLNTISRPLDIFSNPNKIQTLTNYYYDLSDLFIALLITRRGGPSNLDTIIRSQKLWNETELLSDNPTLQEIADRIRLIDLSKSGSAVLTPPQNVKNPSDIQASFQKSFEEAMNKTLIFPTGIFAPFQKPIHGLGWREFHVVKQHIRGYELGEIARFENILKGESRDHNTKHTLSNERDTFSQTVSTTETDKELTSTDHVDIKNEVQDQLKEATKVDAGVHAQYKSGESFKLQADLTVSYNKSSDETKKFASDVSKDITQKATSKVTNQVTQSQTTKIIETFEENEDQSFDNKAGKEHISGVYQWVNKVYLAQTFNLGRHLLFDIMVPEPGASLLSLATIPPVDQRIPKPPYPLGTILMGIDGKPILDKDRNLQLDVPLSPTDLIWDNPKDDNFYSKWVARYNATSIEPPPQDSIILSVAKDVPTEDNTEKGGGDVLRIDDGYGAFYANARVTWKTNDDTEGGVGQSPQDSFVHLSVGNIEMLFRYGQAASLMSYSTGKGRLVAGTLGYPLNTVDPSKPLDGGTIAYVFKTNLVNGMTLDLQITCKPTDTLIAKWQLQTYEKIATAWQKLQSDYESQIAALQFQKGIVGPLGAANPDANRLTERVELKRGCIAIIDNENNTVRGVEPNVAVAQWPVTKPEDLSSPQLPEPILKLPDPMLIPDSTKDQYFSTAQDLGAKVRWFEQAFEWENIAYIFYPYYWGRRSRWIQSLNLKNDDPLFLNFLQAGYARVVVPVRLGFEWAILFYLHTGLPWLGEGLPPIGDKTQNPLYLDIAEEIKATTGGGENNELELPIGNPWEIKLPTTLIKLRKDDLTPSWSRIGPNTVTSPTPPKLGPDPDYPSDPPIGAWTWSEDKTPQILPYTS